MFLNWGYAAIKAQMIAKNLQHAGLTGQQSNLPIIYLPGILGSKLYDLKNQSMIWGDHKGIFHKNDYEYPLDKQSQILAASSAKQLHSFTILPGIVDIFITMELKMSLERALSYREGVDLIFLAHDWRADHRLLASMLANEIKRIQKIYGEQQKIILIAQSASNCAIRYFLQSTNSQTRDSIAKWYAFGPPWSGTFQALSMFQTGYYAGSRLFNGFTPDDIAGYPSAYQLLPYSPQIIDGKGNEIKEFNIYDPECWKSFHMGPYRKGIKSISAQCQRNRNQLIENLSSAKSFAESTVRRTPADRAVPQVWYLSDNHQAVKKAIYDKGHWYLRSKDILHHYPHLASQALSPGDDHLPVDELLQEWEGPVIRDKNQHPWGNEFAFISQAKTHRKLVNYTPNIRSLIFDIATLQQEIKKKA